MKRFNMRDEDFICINCGKEVSKLNTTARDHCNNCLYSIHVDINPGDRLCDCLGILKPIGIERGKKDTYKIVYVCTKCKMIKRNVAAVDDNFDKILEIMANPVDLEEYE